jgi:hypothetical protein
MDRVELRKKRLSEKRKVMTKTLRLIREGKIKRLDYCENCKETGKIDIHHPIDENPFIVNFLCRKCHSLEHSNKKTILV